MKITNKHDLPEGVFGKALEPRPALNPNRIGVTDFIGPVKARELKRRHYDEIEYDISDSVWALVGTGVHAVIADYSGSYAQHDNFQ